MRDELEKVAARDHADGLVALYRDAVGADPPAEVDQESAGG